MLASSKTKSSPTLKLAALSLPPLSLYKRWSQVVYNVPCSCFKYITGAGACFDTFVTFVVCSFKFLSNDVIQSPTLSVSNGTEPEGVLTKDSPKKQEAPVLELKKENCLFDDAIPQACVPIP